MSTDGISEKHGQLFFQLQLAAHRLRKVADRRVTAETGLTTAQAAILYIVAARKNVMQKEIAKRLGQNESAVVAMANRLTRLGYLGRRRSDVDSRTSMLNVTAKGMRELQIAKRPFRELDNMLDKVFSPAELDAISLLLTRLADALAAEAE
jgi:MarR family transcriptional regulator, organic hydroperoxide resistance regulator